MYGQNSQTELPHSFLFAFQLLFEGVVGNGEQGDISLDDVAVSYVCNGMDKKTCSSYFGTALERCKAAGKWQGRFLDKHRVLNESREKVTLFLAAKCLTFIRQLIWWPPEAMQIFRSFSISSKYILILSLVQLTNLSEQKHQVTQSHRYHSKLVGKTLLTKTPFSYRPVYLSHDNT